jgi:hypothetical protein
MPSLHCFVPPAGTREAVKEQDEGNVLAGETYVSSQDIKSRFGTVLRPVSCLRTISGWNGTWKEFPDLRFCVAVPNGPPIIGHPTPKRECSVTAV